MEQTILTAQERPLLARAMSMLSPVVFLHPVWIRFGAQALANPLETLQSLMEEAEELQEKKPLDACQLFLICAVLQNYSTCTGQALATLQKVLELTRRFSLTNANLWATWGACAVSIQQGNLKLADLYFRHLEASLYEQNDWMLAGYVEVVRQFFIRSAELNTEVGTSSKENLELETLLQCSINWLHHWGISEQLEYALPHSPPSSGSLPQAPSPRFSSPFQGWHTLKLIFQGELKLHWAKSDPIFLKKPASILGSILSSLHILRPEPRRDGKVIEDHPRLVPPSSTGVNSNDPPSSSSLSEAEANVKEESSTQIDLAKQEPPGVSVSIQMLGKFGLNIQDTAVRLHSTRNLSLLKYLLLNHKQSIPREMLMDIFWPEASLETARNNLNVAIHGIRKALHQVIDRSVILYQDGAYSISPVLQIWLDVEEFESLVGAAKRLEVRDRAAAISRYETAISLYQGDFLEENIYEGWTVLTRESLRMAYLDTLDHLGQIYFENGNFSACINSCHLILDRDPCREDAHCLLMRCYNRQGQDQLAVRQYQACVNALRSELDVAPTPATTQLCQLIRQHKHV